MRSSNWPLLFLTTMVVLFVQACGGGHQATTTTVTPTMIGPSGGTVSDANGDQLQIPQNALTSTISVTLTAVSQQDLTISLGRDVTAEHLTLLAAVKIDMGGVSFAKPATLSFPNTGNIPSSRQPILMHLLSGVNGSSTLILSDAAIVKGSQIVTGIQGTPGILHDGIYALLNPAQPLQLFSGTVVDQNGKPVENAIVVPLEGPQFVAQTDPGNFVAAVPLPAQQAASFPVNIATMSPPAAATQFGLVRTTLTPSPNTVVDAGIISNANASRLQLANVDLASKCPSPDPFLKEKLTDLLADLAKKLSGIASSTTIPVTPPTSISLSPANRTAVVTLDFGAYFNELLNNPVPGGTITDASQLPPFLLFHQKITAQVLALGGASAVLPTAADRSLIAVSSPPILLSNGLKATVNVSLPTAGQHDGSTTILGCVSQVVFTVENNYSLAIDEAGNSCSGGKEGPEEISITPADRNSICMETVVVTVTGTSFNLALHTVGAGTGTISASPQGTSCGPGCFAYPTSPVATVQLTATPAPGSTFAGWSGACLGAGSCSVTMNQNQSVTADFEVPSPTFFNLTVNTTGTGSGTVSPSPAGTSCGAGCYSYLAGTVVQLTAKANAGSTFAGWSGTCSGTGSCTITMNQNRSVTADFETAGPPPPVTGTWAGFWTRPISGLCAFETSSLMWNLSQTGSSVAGTFTEVVTAIDPNGLCPDSVGDTSSGNLVAGVITGNSLTIFTDGGTQFTGTVTATTVTGTGGTALGTGPFTLTKQ